MDTSSTAIDALIKDIKPERIAALPREQRLKLLAALAERKKRDERARQEAPGGLIHFVRYFWDVLEPETKFVNGWAMEAICLHLEAVDAGRIKKLLINVPPGFSKSLISNVFFPAWRWSAKKKAHLRFLSFSYSSHLTERDNAKMRDLIKSPKFQAMYGDRFKLTREGQELISTDKTGWKLASSVGGVSTGERGDMVTCLPASEPIFTDNGWMEIGDIVDGELPVKIAGELNGRIVWQSIEKYEKNPGGSIYEIRWPRGSVRCTADHPVYIHSRGYVRADSVAPGDEICRITDCDDLQVVRRPDQGETVVGTSGEILQQALPSRGGVQRFPDREQSSMSSMREAGLSSSDASSADTGRPSVQHSLLWEVEHRGAQSSVYGINDQELRPLRQDVHQAAEQAQVLLSGMRTGPAPEASKGCVGRESPVPYVSDGVHSDSQETRALRSALCGENSLSPHGGEGERPMVSRQDARAPDAAPLLERQTVVSVERVGYERTTYNVSVVPAHNYFAGGGALLHNCDDANSVKSQESRIVREETNRWFMEGITNRLNNASESSIIVIQQRLHDEDLAGAIISANMGYVLLLIPMAYDPSRHCKTSIGWEDPRTVEGELAWPERFPEAALKIYKNQQFMWASQYQQTPQVRGGNIFKYEWWKPFDMGVDENGKRRRGMPPNVHFTYKIASVDTSMTKKTINDPSACSVWGVFVDPNDNMTKVVLLAAWEKHLELTGGSECEQKQGEPEHAWINRTRDKWGLVEWIVHTSRVYKVDRLLIEATAAGHPAAQALRNLTARQFPVQLYSPRGDKETRAHAVTYLFAEEMVYAPADSTRDADGNQHWEFRKFARLAIDQMARFPRGRDDIVDTASAALQHLRDTNSLYRKIEAREQEEDERRHYRDPEPLYPV